MHQKYESESLKIKKKTDQNPNGPTNIHNENETSKKEAKKIEAKFNEPQEKNNAKLAKKHKKDKKTENEVKDKFQIKEEILSKQNDIQKIMRS